MLSAAYAVGFSLAAGIISSIIESVKEDRNLKLRDLPRRIGRFILIVLAAIWLMFEEWVWDSIMAVMEKIGRLKIISRFESVLVRQNPYLLLFLFLFPFFIMIPAKIYGLYLIADGKVVRGVSIFVLAKGLITAILTRLFFVTKEKLMQIQAFAASYAWIKEKKEWLYAELDKLPAWHAARRTVAEAKRFIREKVGSLTAAGGLIAKIKEMKRKMKKRIT